MSISKLLLLTGALGVAMAVSPLAVSADTVLKPNSLFPATAYETKIIKLKNVEANLMAWWLDPTHNQRPNGFSLAPDPTTFRGQPNFGSRSITNDGDGKTLRDFPGLRAVIVLEPSQIMVVGESKEMTRLLDSIAFLDRPMRQVQFEIKSVEIGGDDLKSLNLSAFSFPGAEPINVEAEEPVTTRPNRQQEEKINQLLATNKARLLNHVRADALHGFTSQLTPTATPKVFELNTGRVLPVSKQKPQTFPTIAPQELLSLKPTVGSDQNIALNVEWTRRKGLGDQQSTYTVNYTSGVADGELLALIAPKDNRMLLIRARIVRTLADG